MVPNSILYRANAQRDEAVYEMEKLRDWQLAHEKMYKIVVSEVCMVPSCKFLPFLLCYMASPY